MDYVDSAIDYVALARRAWAAGDFDRARDCYQKASYGIDGTSKANVEAFTREVAEFAGEDPFYSKMICLIRSYISTQRAMGKPVLQSDMTAFVESHYGDAQTNLTRYVLYYAEVRKEIYRRKHGRSYLLALSAEDFQEGLPRPAATIQTIHPTTNAFTALFEPMAPYQRKPELLTDEELGMGVWDLYRQATVHKNAKEWDKAIECLYEARAIDGTANEWLVLTNLLRLPLFLQQAGYFEAANFEFNHILSTLGMLINREIKTADNPGLSYQWLQHLYLGQIFDKARVAYKRQRLIDQSKHFAELAATHQQKSVALEVKINAPKATPRQNGDRDGIIRAIAMPPPPPPPIPSAPSMPPPIPQAAQANKQTGCLTWIAAGIGAVCLLVWLFL